MKRLKNIPLPTRPFLITIFFSALVLHGCKDLEVPKDPFPPGTTVDHEVGQPSKNDAEFDVSATLEEHLNKYDVDFTTDSLPADLSQPVLVYTNEYVIRWADNVSTAYKDSLRKVMDNEYRISWYPCMCENMTIELWISQGPIPTNERENAKGSSGGKVEEFDPNIIFGTEFFKGNQSVLTTLDMASIPLIHSGDPTATKIAILDTGFDFDNTEYNNLLGGFNLQVSSAEMGGAPDTDDDSNCLPDDMGGWDFVNDDNRAEDDHSHGTHVASLLSQEVMAINSAAKFVILPLKTHNERGNASLYTLACALKYAISKSVDFVNGSWGYDGPPAGILERALDDLKDSGAIFVGSSGNGGIDMAAEPHQPSMRYFEGKNATVSVNADSMTVFKLWEHSNFHSSSVPVNLSAPGVNQIGFVPAELLSVAPQLKVKSGTSMSAPIVLGGMVAVHQAGMSTSSLVPWFVSNCFENWPATAVSYSMRRYSRTLVIQELPGI